MPGIPVPFIVADVQMFCVLQAQDEESKALRQQVHKTECEMERLQKKLQLEQQIAKVRSDKSLCGLSTKVNIAGM